MADLKSLRGEYKELKALAAADLDAGGMKSVSDVLGFPNVDVDDTKNYALIVEEDKVIITSKVAAEVWAVGDRLYYRSSSDSVSNLPVPGDVFIGFSMEIILTTVTTAYIMFTGLLKDMIEIETVKSRMLMGAIGLIDASPANGSTYDDDGNYDFNAEYEAFEVLVNGTHAVIAAADPVDVADGVALTDLDLDATQDTVIYSMIAVKAVGGTISIEWIAGTPALFAVAVRPTIAAMNAILDDGEFGLVVGEFIIKWTAEDTITVTANDLDAAFYDSKSLNVIGTA